MKCDEQPTWSLVTEKWKTKTTCSRHGNSKSKNCDCKLLKAGYIFFFLQKRIKFFVVLVQKTYKNDNLDNLPLS